ncbi:flavin-containing monooxygenase [Stigmatella hybrida]|uniref:flavin-containing monooxygenase n=1 Tax=Stigmatella hybrida TaxID=394097 RepID=UPI001CDA9725|nr:NAD(P)/FAD-dependent oxidoreductase [Stigmatella hybrida]
MQSTEPSPQQSTSDRYCIIGAGFCGLGVSKAFLDYGVAFDCLDKNSEVGGNWLDGVYDSTHLISSRDSTGFTGFPMPEHYPDFPSRAQVLDYLKSFADSFNLRQHIEFRKEVTDITPVDAKGMKGWNVRLSSGETRHYRGVVVANGHHWDKRIPAYPGVFTGKSLHSKDYKNISDFDGKRVLVVGSGNSGCDIAVEAATYNFESTISMRRGYHFLPKTVLGIPTAEVDRPWFPMFAQKLFLKTMLRLTNGSNEKYGLATPDHNLYDYHPILNSQLMYFIRHGRISPKPDIEKFENKNVYFKDGTQKEIDTLVWATGFHASLPFLDRKFFEWENGYPKRVANMMAPGIANLYIFGLVQPRGGAGPLISEASRLLAEIILSQEGMNHPIAEDFVRLKAADARMLVGVTQFKREIRLGRFLLKHFVKRAVKQKKGR